MLHKIISDDFILPIFGLKSSGVSDINNTIDNEFRGVSVHLEETEPYWYKLETIRNYWDEINDYFVSNWDGYGAKAISRESFVEAIIFYFNLPHDLSKPELLPLPSGEVAFEWYKNGQSQFSITFSGENTIVYAGIYGPVDTRHGTSYFNESISDELMSFINKVYK